LFDTVVLEHTQFIPEAGSNKANPTLNPKLMWGILFSFFSLLRDLTDYGDDVRQAIGGVAPFAVPDIAECIFYHSR